MNADKIIPIVLLIIVLVPLMILGLKDIKISLSLLIQNHNTHVFFKKEKLEECLNNVQIENLFPKIDILKDKSFEKMRNSGGDPCEALKFDIMYIDFSKKAS